MEMPKEKDVAEVVTCRAGKGGCPMAVIDVGAVAEQLAEVLADPDIKSKLDEQLKKQFNFHSQFCAVVTGCPNACAQPQIKEFGVTGRARIELDESLCTECGACEAACNEGAISIVDGMPEINESLCIGCCDCVRVCQSDALSEGRPRYEVSIGGKLGRHPRLAESVGEFETVDEVVDLFRRVIDLLLSEGRKGERLGALLERLGGGRQALM